MDFYPPIDWTEHPLHAAAFSGNRAKVEQLLAQGADVNELLHLSVNKGDLAGTPLHVALFNCGNDTFLYRGHHEVVTSLLAAGANVDLCRLWEGTPLHDAARLGLTHMAGLLIAHGADVTSKGDYGYCTPLHFAAAYGKMEMVEYLLCKGAMIDAVAEGAEETSLYWRQYSRLKKSSARTFRRKPGGKTPLQAAAIEGHVEVVKRLIERVACLLLAETIDLVTSSRSWGEARFSEIITLLNEVAK
jgi:ankyrin repeat protein